MSVTINIYEGCAQGHPPRVPWRLKTFGPVSEQAIPPGLPGVPMTAVLTSTQQADFEYPKAVDRKGHPAPVEDGSIRLTSSDETVATVTPDPANPYKGTIVAVGTGVCQVNITADADLGDGVTTIHGEAIDVQVTGGVAVGIGSPTVGAPTEQP